MVLAVALTAALLASGHAFASPWAEVGDSQLRSDIEVLAAAGVIDDVTMQWPIPWGGIVSRLRQSGALDGQPDFVRDAARRVAQRGTEQAEPGRLHFTVTGDFTNNPSVVRAFDALGREDMQGQASAEWVGETTAIRLSVGAQSHNRYDHQSLVLDDSYIAQRIGNAALYAGYLTHWWGPGWISAMSVSNNARPFPQVGLARADTTAFQSSWLRWLGAWQAEFFVGWLDGHRVAENTLIDGLRVNFSPLPGLEIGLARLDELCGTGHPCQPLSTYFDLRNDPTHPSRTNDEGNMDIRYTKVLGGVPFAVYAQFMNEDTNPLVHSGTSHLLGASTWVPFGSSPLRLSVEYADSIATTDIFSFGNDIYGFSYHDYKYADGMRYRDRTLGFSLDGDSRLASLQASWLGRHDITYTLTYHHASIGSPHDPANNIVTTSPVTINIGDARVHIPFRHVSFDLEARIQDDQPRPDHGYTGAFEANMNFRL